MIKVGLVYKTHMQHGLYSGKDHPSQSQSLSLQPSQPWILTFGGDFLANSVLGNIWSGKSELYLEDEKRGFLQTSEVFVTDS